ncbi:hypothetical protein LTR53_001566 [Teratosphaeriaceae sp. CCFEE 6253]|nr:hypothetical protein LTR53_001566 [Teratosphaeriaceae sp. CCFEE 6253]
MAKFLSQEVVWDDSALVTSWNEALEEYKVSQHDCTSISNSSLTRLQKYHSLAAKGEKVKIVRDEAENEGVETSQDAVLDNAAAKQLPSVPGAAMNVAVKAQDAAEVGPEISRAQQDVHSVGPAAGMPQILMNSLQDEGLKNIMMSWYYAGYYTGLYEGQQKAYTSPPQGG